MNNKCDKNSYTDLSKLELNEWTDAEKIVGLDACNNLVVVSKPEYELSEEDREKLNSVVVKGNGNKFLADDGEYKNFMIELNYHKNINSFVLNNFNKFLLIKENAQAGIESVITLNMNGISLPLTLSHSENKFVAVYDETVSLNYLFEDTVNERARIRFELYYRFLQEQAHPVIDFCRFVIDSDARENVINIGKGDHFLADDGKYKFINRGKIAYYTPNDNLASRSNIILPNDKSLFGLDTKEDVQNIARVSAKNITEIGSPQTPLNLNSAGRPSVKTGRKQVEEVAYKSEVDGLNQEFNQHVDTYNQHVEEYNQHITEYNEYKEQVSDSFGKVNESIDDLREQIHDLDGKVDNHVETYNKHVGEYNQHLAEYGEYKEQVNDSFGKVNESIDGIRGQVNDLDGKVDRHIETYDKHVEGYNQHVSEYGKYKELVSYSFGKVTNELKNHQRQIHKLDAKVDSHTQEYNLHINEYNQYKKEVKDSFETIHTELNDHQEQITENAVNIGVNAQDISLLREDFNNQEHFRGVYLTNDEIADINSPSGGDYGWSLESGTIWVFDTEEEEWIDSTEAIPSGALTLSNRHPVANGEAEAGTSVEVSRADHRHPSDTTKADVTDLEKFVVNGESDRNVLLRCPQVTLDHQSKDNQGKQVSNNLILNQYGLYVGVSGDNKFYYKGEEVAVKSDHYTKEEADKKYVINGNNEEDVNVESNAVRLNSMDTSGAEAEINLFQGTAAINAGRLKASFITDVELTSENSSIELTSGRQGIIGLYSNTDVDVKTGTPGLFRYNGREVATKEDIITTIEGDGTKYLADDGTYKEISGLEEYYLPLTGGTMSGPLVSTSTCNFAGGGQFGRETYVRSANLRITEPTSGDVGVIIQSNESDATVYGSFRHYPATGLVVSTESSLGIDLQVPNNSTARYNGNEIATTNDIITVADGDGTKYLADDGTYKEIETGNKVIVHTAFATGQASVELPEGCTILSVNYNRLMLFPEDYSYTGTTLNITNLSISNGIEADDRMVVTYI